MGSIEHAPHPVRLNEHTVVTRAQLTRPAVQCLSPDESRHPTPDPASHSPPTHTPSLRRWQAAGVTQTAATVARHTNRKGCGEKQQRTNEKHAHKSKQRKKKTKKTRLHHKNKKASQTSPLTQTHTHTHRHFHQKSTAAILLVARSFILNTSGLATRQPWTP